MKNPTASASYQDLASLLRKIAREIDRRAEEATQGRKPITKEYIQAVTASLLWIEQEQNKLS